MRSSVQESLWLQDLDVYPAVVSSDASGQLLLTYRNSYDLSQTSYTYDLIWVVHTGRYGDSVQ